MLHVGISALPIWRAVTGVLCSPFELQASWGPSAMPSLLDQRYDFLDEIGQGGMAVVYRGYDRHLRREVAIKALRADIITPNGVRSFHDEAEATSKLSHPNIVNLYDFGELSDGRLAMVIEFLHGRSLAKLIAEYAAESRTIPWSRIVGIAVQVCAALSAAHACGIVHHDITPANIFLIEGRGIRGDHVKVLDFGIAKITAMTQSSTIANVAEKSGLGIKGTPYYIAPEVVKGTGSDHRVDIYGLGAIMYELCTGKPPFVHNNLYALFMRIAQGGVIPPTAANHACELSSVAEAVVLDAMACDPDQRPQTADELARRLEASIQTATAIDPPPRHATTNPHAAIGFDHTLPHTGPPPGFVAPAVPPPATISPPRTQHVTQPTIPLAAITLAAITQPEPDQPEPSTTSATRPSHVLWRFFGLGLGLGGAAVFGFLAREYLFPPPEANATVQSPVEPGVSEKTLPSHAERPPAPSSTSKSVEDVDRARLAAIKDRLKAAKPERLDCLMRAELMLGPGYELPAVVSIAADGTAKAALGDIKGVSEELMLDPRAHACILGILEAKPFPPADHPSRVHITIAVEE